MKEPVVLVSGDARVRLVFDVPAAAEPPADESLEHPKKGAQP